MDGSRIILSVVLASLLVAGAAVSVLYLWSRRPEIAALGAGARPSFSPELVVRGAHLAAFGDCHLCHTRPGGADYAGDRPIPTPFGIVYSSNITPDDANGIGAWPEDAFGRAMRQGISRDGKYLYPAFPYDHYAKLSESDIRALYAFLMTRSPAGQRPRANTLGFPFSLRWAMAVWDLLFLDHQPFAPDSRRNADWNRGAYLVAGLGHCGDCHTPRNWLGAEVKDKALSGGTVEGWQAPALNAASAAPVPWTAAQLFAYLRRGRDTIHGAAAGPMLAVSQDEAGAEEGDVRAVAQYLASLQQPPRTREAAPVPNSPVPNSPVPNSNVDELGATLFAGACSGCHAGGPPVDSPAGIDLAGSTAINSPDPADAILVIEQGIHPEEGLAGPAMPSFAGTFTDAQLAALLRYLRMRYSQEKPWAALERRVAVVRHESRAAKEQP